MINKTRLKKQLKNIIQNSPDTIRAEVAQEAFAYASEDITPFFSDVLQQGCQSGMVGKQVYLMFQVTWS